MTTVHDLMSQLERAPDGLPVEVDGLCARDVVAVLGRNHVVTLCAVSPDLRGSLTAPPQPYSVPRTLTELVALVEEAHRCLHEDRVAMAHKALHAARTGWALHLRDWYQERLDQVAQELGAL